MDLTYIYTLFHPKTTEYSSSNLHMEQSLVQIMY